MTEFWANKKFKQFQNEGCQFDWCRRRGSIIGWGLFSCCCLDAVQLTHTKLTVGYCFCSVWHGWSEYNFIGKHEFIMLLPDFLLLKCFFCQFWRNNKAAHRENAGQRCSFLIHSHKIISRNIINMFHSSDLCVSLLCFSSDSRVSFKTKNLSKNPLQI